MSFLFFVYICLPSSLSVCLPVSLFVYLYICLSTCISVCPCLSDCMSVLICHCLPICLSLSVCHSVSLKLYFVPNIYLPLNPTLQPFCNTSPRPILPLFISSFLLNTNFLHFVSPELILPYVI